MIVLRVLSYNGDAADGPQAQFDELGGTIGRADNNQLVLPDPERTISRVHARIVFRAGGYAVVDNGSNPISVNNLPVGAGREQALKPGDQLQIGGYIIAASEAASALSNDPFADLFGDAGGLAAPAPAPAPARAALPSTAMWPPQPATASPPAASASWPAPPSPAPARNATLAAGHIPEDWDPFAPDPASGPAEPAAPMGDPFGSLPASPGSSLDELFGLSSGPMSGDPLGTPPAQQALAPQDAAGGDDPLASLMRTATLMPASRSDHASELNTPMPKIKAPAPPPSAPTPSPLPAGAVFSWNDPPRDGRVVTLPGVRRSDFEAAMPPPPAPPATTPAPAPAIPRNPVAAPAAAAASAPAAPAAAGDEAELLAALLQGLDTPGLRLNALTPETMRLLGQLFRESMRGAVELLVARAALKREMRAEMTMIVSRENNPLKFSPTVEVALQHLLGPTSPGFMPAAAAVRDAFDDLRAHQLGVMAGMRAALEGVLGRFDPAQLESKLTHKSAINSLIPATRKARLWESFQELFAQLQAEAQDDFDELFGKAFLRAYEDQLDRLQREPGPR